MSDGPLVIAVPSKGRLQENAAAFFARAGLPLSQARGARDYRGSLPGVPGVEVLFLSAAEIVAQLAAGTAHLGVTGEDLLREGVHDVESRLELLTPLGFGSANVVVAVPQSWIDVRTMADLDEVAHAMRARHGRRVRVATKYVNLTRRFFAETGVLEYLIVESPGATEAAPQSGTADLIVDITTTGATLAANGLKVLDDGVILRSEANLVASLGARWGETARAAARTVLGRIAAEELARTTREVRAGMDPGHPGLAEVTGRVGATRPAGRSSGPELVLHCGADRVFDLVDGLIGLGAEDVTVHRRDYVFRIGDPMVGRLFGRLDQADCKLSLGAALP
ncbi:ATP phosphoribosyltransferase [Enterovirga sp.]|jgi:ATP phosphoribosyltransferase|uniref:ATP phosphoribosyltransferase n=1 Tax=Enterovirga sp. TaxID=2026350 RepID=UPI002639C9A8|nr:ATP phosphoribosyltransferase [Enterovirga sp.]MDB5590887.1 phosphoribosyltransferase [Enterovirga sp.]